MRDYIIYTPILKLEYLGVCCKVFTILFRSAKINLVSTFTEDRKFITFTSSKDYGMLSHDLHNLVWYIPEEDCGSTVTLIKFWVDYRWTKMGSFSNNYVLLLIYEVNMKNLIENQLMKYDLKHIYKVNLSYQCNTG